MRSLNSPIGIIYGVVCLATANFVYARDDGGVVEGCCENELAFGCKEEGAVVVVKEAWIHDGLLRVPNHKCHIPEYNVQFKRGSVLQHINKICAMKRACRFHALRDVPGAKEEEERWRSNVLRVDYECVQVGAFVRACGEKLQGDGGWIQNVGYPKYYLGPDACTFTLIVDQGQKVTLNILDLSTKEIQRPAESECRDYITVTEGSHELLRTCGDSNKPIIITSRGNVLNLTLHTSVDVYPKRGLLANFKASGCPTPDSPDDGYLSHRNSTHAEYWCCVRHVFPDSMQRIRILKCKYGLYWDQEIPDCVDLDDLLLSGNITENEYWRYNGSATGPFFLREAIVYDVVVPGVIMSSLIIGNAVILALIILCRRRLKANGEGLEELESIKNNAEQTDVSDPITVPCQV